MKKPARRRTIKTSCELPAGAGKFPPVTRRNRRQSVPAEIYACIRRYFYLRISLPAAFAGNFARASFTVLALTEQAIDDPINLRLGIGSVPQYRELFVQGEKQFVDAL